MSKYGPGIAVIIIVLATLGFLGGALTSGRQLLSQTASFETVSLQSRELADGQSLNTAFFTWARARMLAGHGAHTYSLDYPQSNPLIYQWATYQLLPARETANEANWVVEYGSVVSRYERVRYPYVLTFAPGMELLRRKS